MVSAAADAAGGGIVVAAAVSVVAAAVVAAAVGVLPGQMHPVVGVEKQPAESTGLTGYCGEDGFPDRQTTQIFDYVTVAFNASFT